MGIKYKDDSKWKTAGLFSEFDKRIKLNDKTNSKHPSLEEVDWVIGCAMLIDLEKFNNKKLFDENIFLYFDEFDLCRRVRSNKGKVYSSKNLFVKHLGNKGSLDKNYTLEFEMLRNWHWMWSTFYYHKKYYGYFYAVYKTYGKLFRSIFKMILFSILLNKKKRIIYFARALGIISAMLGKKSSYRIKYIN